MALSFLAHPYAISGATALGRNVLGSVAFR